MATSNNSKQCWNLIGHPEMVKSEELLSNFLEERKLIPTQAACPSPDCGIPMVRYGEMWRCPGKILKPKKKPYNCYGSQSI
jgi:hypothetical protein